MNVLATIGHNQPPPFEAFSLHIDDLYAEAKNFLDGEPITTQQAADAVGNLLSQLRKAAKDAEAARKEEKRPHDEAGKAVQTKWSPVINRAEMAVQTCSKALTPFLEIQREEARRVAEAVQQEARQKVEAARQAAVQMRPDSLADREALEALRSDADKAEKAAKRADKAKPQVAGDGRAIGLRMGWRAELTDPLAFGKWLWEHRRADYEEFLMEWAQRESRHGPRGIPGVTVIEQPKAV